MFQHGKPQLVVYRQRVRVGRRRVVRRFVNATVEEAKGEKVLRAVDPGQQFVKIIYDRIVKLLGDEKVDLQLKNPDVQSVVLLLGLQGAGKTTMCGKLAVLLKKQYGKSPMLCACDIYRPAAIEQLKVVGSKAEVPVYEHGTQDPVKTALEAVEEARRTFRDVLIVDTAGRLHIDEDMMDELKCIRDALEPAEILLVVDAMTGQDAVNVAKAFNEAVPLTGVVLTKLDGDTRGGAALSVRAVTGKPIKFAGTGEKLTDLEAFHPDRMASRILGMGDMLTLIEKAEQAFDQKKAAELEKKMRTDTFTLDDFLDQMEQMKDMGSMEDILKMIPGMGGKLNGLEIDEKAMGRTKAIIQAMTPKERANPDILNASRRRRIARGSGTTIQDVNKLMNQFEASRKMMKQMTGGLFKKGKKGKKMRGGFPFGF